jgi:hypothetical protein
MNAGFRALPNPKPMPGQSRGGTALVQREPKRGETDKALACFGAVRHDTDDVLLYFSDGQPNSLQMWLFIIGLLAVADRKANGCWLSSGTTPVGTKALTCGLDTRLQSGSQGGGRTALAHPSAAGQKSLAQSD